MSVKRFLNRRTAMAAVLTAAALLFASGACVSASDDQRLPGIETPASAEQINPAADEPADDTPAAPVDEPARDNESVPQDVSPVPAFRSAAPVLRSPAPDNEGNDNQNDVTNETRPEPVAKDSNGNSYFPEQILALLSSMPDDMWNALGIAENFKAELEKKTGNDDIVLKYDISLVDLNNANNTVSLNDGKTFHVCIKITDAFAARYTPGGEYNFGGNFLLHHMKYDYTSSRYSPDASYDNCVSADDAGDIWLVFDGSGFSPYVLTGTLSLTPKASPVPAPAPVYTVATQEPEAVTPAEATPTETTPTETAPAAADIGDANAAEPSDNPGTGDADPLPVSMLALVALGAASASAWFKREAVGGIAEEESAEEI